jgi:hypothetical protein
MSTFAEALYPLVLRAHSLLRWAVLLAGVWAVAAAASGWLTGRAWTPADARAARRFATALDLQVTLGLLLYVGLSPLTRAAFRVPGAARAAEVRFFAGWHLAAMLAATACAHVGAVAAQRATTDVHAVNAVGTSAGGVAGAPAVAAAAADRPRHRTALLWSGLALAAILAGVPWWRPLLRLG